ncbi:sigma factor [Amycolatopsis sp. H20-H5]|uniref:sigma factor n=1 Tax=Amycolatopsis sp. H20-H5 TaxID=3046309 RepID=UPI002DB9C804|nr:sigma factor [Amycolatopsis sp. H20-H5]MEC3981422.1 sigma factor [Amycolatopsis sp. H20-H5]
MTEQGTVPHQAASGSDEQALLQRLRNGDDSAFGELFELHAAAVRRLAGSLASDRSEAEDITAETFFRVLQALRRGSGPRDYIRAYLLTVARRVSWEWHGARRDVPVSDDELTFRAGAGADTHARSAEHTLITTAFTSLPERWRTVLWQTEVEGEQPAMVAPNFGLSANATAALARRARQGLRAAYLQAHLSVSRSPDSCRGVVEKLGGFTAGSVTGAEARRIQAHLIGCTSCRATHDELRDVCSSLRAHAGVLVLLVPAALSYGTASGALSGLATTLKGLVLGSKVKVGLALASTAAAGAVGIAAGPIMFGQDAAQTVGLSGGGVPELALIPPGPQGVVPPPPPVAVPRIGTAELNGRRVVPVVPARSHDGSALGVHDLPNLPDGAATGNGLAGGSGAPVGSSSPDAVAPPPGSSTHAAPRLDTSEPSNGGTTAFESTSAPTTTCPPAPSPMLSPTSGPPETSTTTASRDDSVKPTGTSPVTTTDGPPAEKPRDDVPADGTSSRDFSTSPDASTSSRDFSMTSTPRSTPSSTPPSESATSESSRDFTVTPQAEPGSRDFSVKPDASPSSRDFSTGPQVTTDSSRDFSTGGVDSVSP